MSDTASTTPSPTWLSSAGRNPDDTARALIAAHLPAINAAAFCATGSTRPADLRDVAGHAIAETVERAGDAPSEGSIDSWTVATLFSAASSQEVVPAEPLLPVDRTTAPLPDGAKTNLLRTQLAGLRPSSRRAILALSADPLTAVGTGAAPNLVGRTAATKQALRSIGLSSETGIRDLKDGIRRLRGAYEDETGLDAQTAAAQSGSAAPQTQSAQIRSALGDALASALGQTPAQAVSLAEACDPDGDAFAEVWGLASKPAQRRDAVRRLTIERQQIQRALPSPLSADQCQSAYSRVATNSGVSVSPSWWIVAQGAVLLAAFVLLFQLDGRVSLPSVSWSVDVGDITVGAPLEGDNAGSDAPTTPIAAGTSYDPATSEASAPAEVLGRWITVAPYARMNLTLAGQHDLQIAGPARFAIARGTEEIPIRILLERGSIYATVPRSTTPVELFAAQHRLLIPDGATFYLATGTPPGGPDPTAAGDASGAPLAWRVGVLDGDIHLGSVLSVLDARRVSTGGTDTLPPTLAAAWSEAGVQPIRVLRAGQGARVSVTQNSADETVSTGPLPVPGWRPSEMHWIEFDDTIDNELAISSEYLRRQLLDDAGDLRVRWHWLTTDRYPLALGAAPAFVQSQTQQIADRLAAIDAEERRLSEAVENATVQVRQARARADAALGQLEIATARRVQVDRELLRWDAEQREVAQAMHETRRATLSSDALELAANADPVRMDRFLLTAERAALEGWQQRLLRLSTRLQLLDTRLELLRPQQRETAAEEERLSRTVSTTTAALRRLDDEIDALARAEEQLSETQAEHAAIVARLAEIETGLAEATATESAASDTLAGLEEREATIESLEREVASAEDNRLAVTGQLEDTEAQLSRLAEDLAALNATIAEQDDELAELTRAFAATEAERTAAQAELSDAQARAVLLRSEIADLEARITTLESEGVAPAEIESAREELAAAREAAGDASAAREEAVSRRNELVTRREELEGRRASLQAALETVESEIADASERLAAAEATAASLAEERDAIAARLEDAQAARREAENRRRLAGFQLNAVEGRQAARAEAEETLAAATDALAAAEAEMAELIQRFDDQAAALQQAHSRRDALLAETSQTARDLAAATEELEALRAQLATQSEQQQAAAAALQQATDTLAERRRSTARADRFVEIRRDSVTAAQTEAAIRAEEAAAASEAAAEPIAALAAVNERLGAAQAELAELTQSRDELQADLESDDLSDDQRALVEEKLQYAMDAIEAKEAEIATIRDERSAAEQAMFDAVTTMLNAQYVAHLARQSVERETQRLAEREATAAEQATRVTEAEARRTEAEQQVTAAAAQVAATTESIEETAAEREALTESMAALSEERDANDEQIAERTQALRETESARANQQTQVEDRQQAVDNAREALSSAPTEAELEAQAQAASDDLARATAAVQEATATVSATEEELAAARDSLADAERNEAAVAAQLEALQQRRTEDTARLAAVRDELEQLATQIASAEEAVATATTEAEQTQSAAAAAEQRVADLEEAQSDRAAALQTAQARLSEAATELETTAATIETTGEQLTTLTSRASAIDATRRQVSESLEASVTRREELTQQQAQANETAAAHRSRIAEIDVRIAEHQEEIASIDPDAVAAQRTEAEGQRRQAQSDLRRLRLEQLRAERERTRLAERITGQQQAIDRRDEAEAARAEVANQLDDERRQRELAAQRLADLEARIAPLAEERRQINQSLQSEEAVASGLGRVDQQRALIRRFEQALLAAEAELQAVMASSDPMSRDEIDQRRSTLVDEELRRADDYRAFQAEERRLLQSKQSAETQLDRYRTTTAVQQRTQLRERLTAFLQRIAPGYRSVALPEGVRADVLRRMVDLFDAYRVAAGGSFDRDATRPVDRLWRETLAGALATHDEIASAAGRLSADDLRAPATAR